MSDSISVIGSNTSINGTLDGDDDLTIEGRMAGTINLSKTLTIEQSGVVHANINVRNAVISGVLVGNVEALDSVRVTDEGRVKGDISAPRVILGDGSSFRGNIDMGRFDEERTREPARASAMPPPAPSTTPKVKAKRKAPVPKLRSVGRGKAARKKR